MRVRPTEAAADIVRTQAVNRRGNIVLMLLECNTGVLEAGGTKGRTV